ncbi:hypothetical protein [Maridesulfovibrio bastinii]|uniref:hypothetical protein n=1 Tax=Maridesulfovibrio bastinii TaxID=47157 RepID=UPI00040A0CD1|nr:hypothetical protein [Maridesulfovibrio bastinii]
MSIPPKSNPKWKSIVSGKTSFTPKFLAGKIALSKLIKRVQGDPGVIDSAVDELHSLYTKNADKPSAQEDIKKIFG